MGSIGPGATITSGVQDIAALLPLLGTESCEEHVGSALTKGYIYAAATPLSIFGSLGMARAGMKTLVAACVIRKWRIFGPKILADVGFKPQGTNLSLIMLDEGHEDKRCLVQRRLDELLDELHIDMRGMEVSCNPAKWNAMMMSLTLVSCLLSITPYIYININGNTSLNRQARWTFPILRAVGGFLTTSMMQLVIQTRVKMLTEKALNRQSDEKGSRRYDVENGLGVVHSENSFLTWCWLVLLLGGILAAIVGYIGCFSIIQSAQNSAGPISWLCIEAGLSVVRMTLWGFNPPWDDAPPLELVLPLEKDPPFPTCLKYEDAILLDKVLPLTRASEFLKSITSSVGLIKHFSHPDLTLYYTMTRKRPTDQPAVTPTQRVLYITVFHHKERTTRVYDGDKFYSTASGLVIDLEHDQLETSLGETIRNLNRDQVIGDNNIRLMLESHHSSIINSINSVTKCESKNRRYTINNNWTMQAEGTKPGSIEPNATQMPNDPSFQDDHRFLELGRLERMRRSLIETRGKWIEDYMNWVIEEMEESVPIGKDLPYRKVDSSGKVGRNGSLDTKERDVEGGELRVPMDVGRVEDERKERMGSDMNSEKAVTEVILMKERYHTEMLLVEEVGRWEQQLLQKMQQFFGGLDSEPAKKHFVTTWSSNCWRRLDTEIRAMDARLNAAKKGKDLAKFTLELSEWEGEIRQGWNLVLQHYIGTPGSQSLPSPSLQSPHIELQLEHPDWSWWIQGHSLSEPSRIRCRKRVKEMAMRLKKEVDDVETRLNRGLECCDQFWSDIELVGFRHSRSKWRRISSKKYSHELSRASDVTHIYCRFFEQADVDWFFERIQEMPQVISIDFFGLTDIICPPIDNNNHLLSITGSVSRTRELDGVLEQNRSQPNQTVILLSTGVIDAHGNFSVFLWSEFATILFFGPTFGHTILRLIHYTDSPNATITLVQGSFQFTFAIPQGSWTTDDIILHPIVSFKPDERNKLTLRVSKSLGSHYHVRDIQLLPPDT